MYQYVCLNLVSYNTIFEIIWYAIVLFNPQINKVPNAQSPINVLFCNVMLFIFSRLNKF